MSALPERLDDRAKDLLLAALERPPTDRSLFLAKECVGEEPLRVAVLALLRAHELADGTFEDEEPAPIVERVGDRIGRYTLLHRIGEGGFGVVWLAEQEEPVRRKVALKVLKAGMDTAQVVGRFEAERQALALMEHPNIAKVFDGGATSTGRPYFVMEVVKGVPITQFCDDAELSMPQRLELFVSVCQAVQHAHQKGVIHRDIKPSNVLVTLHDGVPVPKVIDFGIAKATAGSLTERRVFTECRQMLGTPEYMAPEQAELSSLDVDTRADIYSLGVLLYELLTGTLPFELKTLVQAGYAAMLRTIKEVDPPKPSTRVSTLQERVAAIARHRRVHPRAFGALMRGDLDWIVMKALEKDRRRRYETATAFAEDVLRHLHHEPALASPPSWRYRWRKYVRRHRVGVAAIAAMVAILTVGLSVSLYSLGEARVQTRVARMQTSVALAAQRGEAAQRAAAERAREGEAAQRQRAEAREKQATAQATKAMKVTTLLRELLISSDPHAAKGVNYPVRLLLDDFGRLLADQLDGEREVEADLRLTLGRSLLGLGLVAAAEPHLRQGLHLCRQASGERSVATAAALLDWSLWLHARDDFAGAIDAAQQALAIWTDAGDAGKDRAADVMRWLSDYHLHLDQLDVALDFARRSLAQERELHLVPHDDVAAACQSLAKVLAQKGMLVAAKAEAEQAVAIDRDRLGPDHPFLASRLLMLTSIRRDIGEYEEAAAAAQQALDIRRRRLGDEHPETALALASLASVWVDQGRMAEAVELYQQAVAIQQRGFVADSSQGLATLHNLGSALADLGRFDEAEKCLRRALELAKACHGPNHTEVATCLGTLGTLLAETGGQEEAVTLIREGMRVLQEVHGDLHIKVAFAANNLAVVLTSLGDSAGAAVAAEQARSILAATVGTEVRLHGLATANLAIAWNGLSRFRDAEKLLRDALPGIARHSGDPSSTLASAWSTLGCSLRDQGRFDEADPCMRKAVELSRQCLPAGHPHIASGLNNLGTLLVAKGELAEAEAAFAEGLEILGRAFGSEHADCGLLLINLAHVSSKRGHVDGALDYGRRAVAAFAGVPDHPLRVQALAKLGSALAAKGSHEEATDCLQQAIALHRRLHLVEETQFAILLLECGNGLLRRQRADEAEPLLRESQAVLARQDPQGSDQYAVQGQVGGALVLQRNYSDAEALLRDTLARVPNAPGSARQRWIVWLAQSLEGLGRTAEAAEWRAKLTQPGGR